MSRPIVYGIDGSPFVATVRVALAEKNVAFEFAAFAIGEQKSPAHLARHPFGRVPAFEHDGFMLYETQAILRYVDRAFDGPALQPRGARELARMDQILNIVDWYVQPSITSRIAFQRIVLPRLLGGTTDESVVAAAIPQARLCIQEIERLMGEHPFLAGDAVSLADFHFAPHLGYLLMTPEGVEVMKPHARLMAWWQRIAARDSSTPALPIAA
jgi:glutathione S-transferase